MNIVQTCQWIISILKFRRNDFPKATTGDLGCNSLEIFGINRVLAEREALPLLDNAVTSTLIPGSFIAFCKLCSSFDEIVADLSKRAVERQVGEMLRNDRYLLRPEKKRPWSFKTRRPFRGRIDKVTATFREKLELAEKVVDEIGQAWKQSSRRGKPMKYDIKKLSASILVKGGLSFEKLAAELKNIKYDATLDGSSKSPCSSYLHYIFDQKISVEWLNAAIKRFDEMSVACYTKFDENLDVFVIDNSAISCITLEIRKFALTQRLMKEQQWFLALTRNATHTVRAIVKSTNKIDPFIPYLPRGSRVLADGEFDVDTNYWASIESGIDFQVKQRKGPIRKPGRKKGQKNFDKQKYRKRKLGERFFGNLETRRHRCCYRKPENRHKGILLLGCEHNIIGFFKNKAWCDQFVKLKT